MRLPPKPPLLVPAGSEDIETSGANYDAALAWLCEVYAYLPDARSRGAAALKVTREVIVTSIGSLRDEWRPYSRQEVGPRGGIRTFNPIDTWAAVAERVAGFQCRPDLPGPLFDDPDDGRRYVNLWLPVEHPQRGGSIDLFLDFMRGLLPDAAERERFFDQLACKLQQPAIPGIAPLMVAHNTHGTGRLMLFQVIEKLIGPAYTSTPPFRELTGRYNEHQTKLVVFINEVRGTDDDYRSTKQHQIMEVLKYLIDPRARRVVINFKYGARINTWTFTWYVLATNHIDALPIRPEDRRIDPYTNGSPREPAFYTRLGTWMTDPLNIGRLHRWLMARDIQGFNPYQCLRTEMRERMEDASKTDVEEAIDNALVALPGAILQLSQIVRAVEVHMRQEYGTVTAQWALVVRRVLMGKLAPVARSKPKTYARTLAVARAWRDRDPQLELARNEKALKELGAVRRVDDFWDAVRKAEKGGGGDE